MMKMLIAANFTLLISALALLVISVKLRAYPAIACAVLSIGLSFWAVLPALPA